ncbi:MAG: hypothetical protein NT137_00150 [Methanomassiliicoccales archaeon]|nr:hypothetical protein [Methanomassiliicoccales archaeon]
MKKEIEDMSDEYLQGVEDCANFVYSWIEEHKELNKLSDMLMDMRGSISEERLARFPDVIGFEVQEAPYAPEYATTLQRSEIMAEEETPMRIDMTDLKAMQLLDMLIDAGTVSIGADKAEKCPVIKMLYDVKEQLRERLNHDLAVEFQIRPAECNGCEERN